MHHAFPVLLSQSDAMEQALAAYVDFLTGEKCRSLLARPGGTACVLTKSILIDVGADGKWHGPQTPRCTWQLDGNGNKHVRRVAIVPITDDTCSVLIYPRSHKMLRQAAKRHDWREKWGFFNSSEEKDANFCSTRKVKEPWRIWLDKGQMLLYDGHLVIAGDESRVLSDNTVMSNSRWAWAGQRQRLCKGAETWMLGEVAEIVGILMKAGVRAWPSNAHTSVPTYCLPCVTRWQFRTAPSSWQLRSAEELMKETEVTVSPSVKYHPDMHCECLATMFKDVNQQQVEEAAAKSAEGAAKSARAE